MMPNQMKSTLDQVLLHNSPALHAKLKQQNQLEATLQPILGRAVESIDEARQEAISSATTMGSKGFVNDPMQRVQTLNSQFKAAEEMALQQAIEEINALTAT